MNQVTDSMDQLLKRVKKENKIFIREEWYWEMSVFLWLQLCNYLQAENVVKYRGFPIKVNNRRWGSHVSFRQEQWAKEASNARNKNAKEPADVAVDPEGVSGSEAGQAELPVAQVFPWDQKEVAGEEGTPSEYDDGHSVHQPG